MYWRFRWVSLTALTCGHAGQANGLQAGEDLVGLRERDAAQLDIGARRDVAAACSKKYTSVSAANCM